MDAKKYLEKKETGLVEIIKTGGGYAYSSKKWDAETGEPAQPEIVAVDLQELKDKKTALQEEITDIDAVIANIEAL